MPINFVCPTCGRELPREVAEIIPHTETHIIDAIKKKYPDWVEANGICKKCYEFYKRQIHPE